MAKIKLDQEEISQLLKKADDRWFLLHRSGNFNYNEHLAFTTAYIAKHYKGGKDHEYKRKGQDQVPFVL